MSEATNSTRGSGRSALVTGAASGIGKAVARLLAEEGSRVALADLNETEAAQVADAISAGGRETMSLRLDVNSEDDWQSAMDEVLGRWGGLDLCVNSAGISFANPIADLDLDDWNRVMRTNLGGVFLGTKHAIRAMRSGGGGCIVNIASAAGIKPLAGNAAYGTSKAAIRFFTRIAALEGAPHQIRVNSISPGAVATPMWEPTGMWPNRVAEEQGQEAALRTLVADKGFAEAEEIAAAVLFLASEAARHITGTDLVVDDGYAIS